MPFNIFILFFVSFLKFLKFYTYFLCLSNPLHKPISLLQQQDCKYGNINELWQCKSHGGLQNIEEILSHLAIFISPSDHLFSAVV